MLPTARLIIETNGVAGLWRGTGPAVVRMGLGVGVQMVRGRGRFHGHSATRNLRMLPLGPGHQTYNP